MRIRTFTGDSTKAAMAAVREEMGEDAVIIAIDEATSGFGVIVRAAVDDGEPPVPQSPTVEDRLEAFLRACLKSQRPLTA